MRMRSREPIQLTPAACHCWNSQALAVQSLRIARRKSATACGRLSACECNYYGVTRTHLWIVSKRATVSIESVKSDIRKTYKQLSREKRYFTQKCTQEYIRRIQNIQKLYWKKFRYVFWNILFLSWMVLYFWSTLLYSNANVICIRHILSPAEKIVCISKTIMYWR